MNTIKTFCAENNIITDADGILFIEGCGTILGFMYEFGFSYTEEDFQYVKGLHDGSSPEMGWWTKERSDHNWMSDLQSIKTFPTYSVLVEFKDKIEAVIHQWVAAR